MTTELRTLRVDEFEDFMRYVERAFGHSKKFFEREYPHLYKPTEAACSWAYVIVEDGEIVSHVGLYPIEVVTAGVRLRVGGIGAVSTTPKARGKGYMTRLLYHIVEEMRRLNYPTSWLGGDRQRYNTFGWEMTSPLYDLTFSRRSLSWKNVEAAEVEEVLPEEALETVARLQSHAACHAIRPDLATQLQKRELRFWITPEGDGYAILHSQAREHLRIAELVSAPGKEINMIRAILDWNFGETATLRLSMWERERLGRLMSYASYWEGGNSDMYRINDLAALLEAARPLLEERAAALHDFSVAIGVREREADGEMRVHQQATIFVSDGEVSVAAERDPAAPYVELGAVEAARLFLGGPAIQGEGELPAGLLALLPVPLYVPPLDHV